METRVCASAAQMIDDCNMASAALSPVPLHLDDNSPLSSRSPDLTVQFSIDSSRTNMTFGKSEKEFLLIYLPNQFYDFFSIYSSLGVFV
jgi:hypothetical protein